MSAERLLIVDDEPALLGLLRRYLEKQGYEVEASPGPRDALARFTKDPAQFSLVISDLTFPEMSGEDMLERMREVNPRLRAILSSGYPHEPRLAGVGFLQKPYLPDMLSAAVAKALKARL